MAMYTPNVPPSSILKSKEIGGNETTRQTKEEYRKMKELEEARKAGTAPAMIDEEGRDINPHIPQFIAQAPWYLGASGPTLKHQRPHPERQKEMSEISDWYQRGVSNKIATKFRKGACENCGAMTHKRRDCFERPRKIGARFTGDDIAPDEHVQPMMKLSFDAKRDRWNGYDPAEHQAVIEEHRRLEETRKMIRAEKMRDDPEALKAAEEEEQVAEEDAVGDEDKYAEDADMPGVKLDTDSRTRITVRNLRIREDTAKYLLNLDANSAYYDPKSRSMRENPYEMKGKKEDEVKFGGENFVRFTGEVLDVNQAQLFAWEAHKRGVDVHALAEPTKLQVLRGEVEGKKDTFKDAQKKTILEMYGGEEHFNSVPKELLLAQSENYVEYSRKGDVLKGVERKAAPSRYEEDVHPGNHSSVWGSFWKDGQWGFKCCHSLVKNSYCLGEAGKVAASGGVVLSVPVQPPPKVEEKKKEERKRKKSESSSSSSSDGSSSDSDSSSTSSSSSSDSESESEKPKKKKKRVSEETKAKKPKKDEASGLEHAMEKAKRQEAEAERLLKLGDRDRPYNSHYDVKAPTDDDMEAYRLRQLLSDDPMAQYLEKKK